MKQLYQTIILFFFIGLLGCTHPISPTFRKDLDSTLTFEQIIENPKKFIGKKILLGGTIVETRVLNVGTEIEVVQKQIDSFLAPFWMPNTDFSANNYNPTIKSGHQTWAPANV